MFKQLFSFLLIVSMVIVTIISGPAAPGTFVDPPSLIILAVTIFGVLLFSFDIKVLLEMFRDSFLPLKGEFRQERASLYVDICDAGIHVSLLSGALLMVIGLILMFQDLSDPVALGVGLSSCLVGLLYSLLLCIFFFVPAKFRFRRAAGEGSFAEAASFKTLAVVPAVLSFVIISSWVLYASFGGDTSSRIVVAEGGILTLDQLVINVPDSEGAWYLGVEINFEFADARSAAIASSFERRLRALVIEEFHKLDASVDDTAPLLKKVVVKSTNDFLMKRFSELFSDEQPVKDVYFSKFIISEGVPAFPRHY